MPFRNSAWAFLSDLRLINLTLRSSPKEVLNPDHLAWVPRFTDLPYVTDH